MDKSQKYYRYEINPYHDMDWLEPPEESCITCSEFAVVRKTAQGVWIRVWGIEKFVLNYGKKRFAYPTKAEALHGYIKRKQKQLLILERIAASSKIGLAAALKLQGEEK